MTRSVLLGLLATMIAWPLTVEAQPRDKAPETARAPAASCDEFLPPRRQVGGTSVGPDECRILSEGVACNIKGQPFRRIEMRISGTVEGFAVKQGARTEYFNDAPDFVFTQAGNTGPRVHGIGRYSGATGHGITLFVPVNAADWNGKLFVTA